MTDDTTEPTHASTTDHTDETAGNRKDPGLTPSRRTFLGAMASAGTIGAGLSVSVGTGAAGVPTPRLHTEGRWIRDPAGNDVTLRGMAPADPGFYRQYHPKSFEEVLESATDTDRGWYPNTVRLPCTQDSIDALGLETYVTEVLRPAVDLLAARDVYALVDFHLIRPYTQDATETYNEENDEELAPINDVMTTFWDRVAPEFAEDEHVLYELFNEPTQPAMYGDDAGAFQAWRDAAQPWVDLVREHAPETPIIIGSPRWTSVTHMAPEYPFEGENLIYAAHIYPDNGAPADFDQWYGEPAADVPVVVTEFGWDPAGGSVDQGTTSGWGEPFREWVEGYENVGWISWCFDDSWEPAFFESPDSGANEPWTLKDDADQMGGYIKTWLEATKDRGIPESTIDDAIAPPVPSGFEVTRLTEIGVEIAWNAVTDEGEAGLSHYNVYVDGERRGQVIDGTATTVDGLQASSTYEIGVSAVDEAGNESNQTTTVAETVATDAGQSAFVEHELPGRIQAEDFDEGGQGIAYHDTGSANEAGADYRETSVDVGTAVESGYNVGYTETGEWLEYTVTVESGSSYEATVRVANGAESGGDLRIEVDRAEVATQNVWPTGGWGNFEEIRVGEVDLPAGEHVVRIVVETSGWNFDWIEFTGGDGGGGDVTPPTAPSNLSVTTTTPSSAEIAWDAATDEGGSGLDHYAISVDGSLDQQVPVGTTSATIADLAAETSYEIGVSAVDAAGNESATVTVEATTEGGDDTTPPTVPGDLSVESTSESSIGVAWSAASDAGTGVDTYAVYVDGSLDHEVAADLTSATTDGLSAATTYEVGVSAIDAAGNESATATVEAPSAKADDSEGDEDDESTADALVVNDYDGDPAWADHRNDLGQWCGAGSFENDSGDVEDGALVFEYDNAGWFVEQVAQDVSDYSTVVLRVRGESGGEESDLRFDMGGARDLLANLTDDSIGTDFTDVAIDMASAGIDPSTGGLSIGLNFWQGGASTLEIDEIRLE
ncbi:alpha-galactosidase protein [Halorhabdus tiamatea SARL4B]|uniref:Alpha-galactosidase protein n=1 Tax=Halorhabdus tiamatea SARL4B TaxID=1033806 RepID=F7PFV2_9EURY|nr:cellulase family glycosylhydrolase [Halorhabdus tiamatea]ERJ04711.1 alpha-galactosidase protein [Halorhabdus tiamatea SARL4B]CCQ34237.1 chitin binding protein [Halorhabdus tiamatea SARL4B]